MELSARSDVELVDPSEVPDWVLETTVSQYFQVAFVILLVYDTIITMDKEVKYFWHAPTRGVNIVYLATRYIGILGSISYLFWNSYSVNLHLCLFSQWTYNISNWSIIVLIDYILAIRVLALYAQDKRLSMILKLLLAIEASFTFGLFIYLLIIRKVSTFGLADGVEACGTAYPPPLTWGIVKWSIPLTYGVILMTLASYKAVEYWRLSSGFKGLSLVKIVIKDQLIYFLLAVVCCSANIMAFRLEAHNAFLSGLMGCFGEPTYLSLMGSQLLINMREEGERGANGGTGDGNASATMSDMEFV